MDLHVDLNLFFKNEKLTEINVKPLLISVFGKGLGQV